MSLRVLDLFCGLGGFSQAFKDRGHYVVGIDLLPPAEIVGDVRNPPISPNSKWDVILASPPCTEFSLVRRWGRNITPSLELFYAARAIMRHCRPHWWVIENVQGAVKFFPLKVRKKCGSRYLWGHFPDFKVNQRDCYGKSLDSPDNPSNARGWERTRLRSKIPYPISSELCQAMERSVARAKRKVQKQWVTQTPVSTTN